VCEVFRGKWDVDGERKVAEVWDRCAPKPGPEQTVRKTKEEPKKPEASKKESLKEQGNQIAAEQGAGAWSVLEAAKAMLQAEKPVVEVPKPKGGRIVLNEEAPYDSARMFVGLRYTKPEGRTLLHWQGQFYRYGGKCWRPFGEGELQQELYEFLDRAVEKRTHERFLPDQTKVNKVVHALAALVNVPDETKAPAWIGTPPDEAPKASELLACQNGLLNLKTRKLLPHTPKLFNLNVLEFEYDETAVCPSWMRFQEEVWGDDVGAIAGVQEMFGLCVTDETRFQKAFMFVGPRRSGKGTMGKVLQGLVGAENYVGPTMQGFVKPHGMQGWIGKKVAVFSDARLDYASAVATERLLSVIGADVLDIERKFLVAWTGVLGTRIVVLTNEIPEFKDESGVLPSRFIVFEMTKSFYGREDIHLADKLLGELPGIFNWALDGWDALVERGYLVQPKSGEAAAETLAVLASRIKTFVEERCELGPEYTIKCETLLEECRQWHNERRLRFTLGVNQFSRKLKGVFPQVSTERPQDHDDPKRPRWLGGIRLRRPQPLAKPVKPVAPAVVEAVAEPVAKVIRFTAGGLRRI
jgi:putative DNA primase/helicase